MTGIAFLGLGEAASAIIGGWGGSAARPIAAYDIKTDAVETRDQIVDRAASLGVRVARDMAEALDGADLVFSTVTADQALVAAEAAERAGLTPNTLYFDLNSCSPGAKRAAEAAITRAGGRYVDVAVMAPVHPKRNRVPLLIAGAHAAHALPLLEALPMSPTLVDGPVGAASAIKMIRSVLVKGLEALTAECVLAGRKAGVEATVLTSLNASHPVSDWAGAAAYNFERAATHGVRRAAEMREVAATLDELGLPGEMTRGAITWQERMAGAPVRDTAAPLDEVADAVLAHVTVNHPTEEGGGN